jgi:signal transduction histidine kinase
MSPILFVGAAILVASLAAAAALLTARRWRAQALTELAARQQQLQRQAELQRDWLAVLAHELRSPISAVTGYAELLADGALGPLDDRILDIVQRIGIAADQLLRIVEGIEDMGTERAATPEPVTAVRLAGFIDSAVQTLGPDALSRNITLVALPGDVGTTTRAEHALRALILTLGAALKVSTGATLHLSTEDADHPAILITGSRLDPDRDDPDGAAVHDSPRLTGAALRIGLARRSAAFAGGTVVFQRGPAGAELRLRLPRLNADSSIDSAEDIP